MDDYERNQSFFDLLELVHNAVEADRANGSTGLTASGYPIIPSTTIQIDGELRIVDVCSCCYQIIEKTWDHADWCENFVDEPLNKFLKDGIQKRG